MPPDATRTFWAPGRVNLIGEYTDLAGGLVLPAALDLGVTLRVAPSELIDLTSKELEGAARLAPDGTPLESEPQGWARYVAAVATELDALGRPAVGIEGELSSTLPIGTGLSSSAALEVAVAVALCAVADFAVEPLELALAAQRAELRAVGVPCGIMDQAASLLGRADQILLLDTGSLAYEQVPFPPELALVVVDSGVRRRLEDSGYAERRRELLAGLAGRAPDDVALDDLADLPPGQARRVRHVVTENARVRETVSILRDGSVERLGDVFRAGHESLRDDLEVTTPELDLLVDLAYQHGALAARMTGGGFGGSIVALTRVDEAGSVADAVVTEYRRQTGRTGVAIASRPTQGAREIV